MVGDGGALTLLLFAVVIIIIKEEGKGMRESGFGAAAS